MTQLIGELAAQASSAYVLLTSATQLGHDLTGAAPRQQRDLAQNWLETLGR